MRHWMPCSSECCRAGEDRKLRVTGLDVQPDAPQGFLRCQ